MLVSSNCLCYMRVFLSQSDEFRRSFLFVTDTFDAVLLEVNLGSMPSLVIVFQTLLSYVLYGREPHEGQLSSNEELR